MPATLILSIILASSLSRWVSGSAAPTISGLYAVAFVSKDLPSSLYR